MSAALTVFLTPRASGGAGYSAKCECICGRKAVLRGKKDAHIGEFEEIVDVLVLLGQVKGIGSAYWRIVGTAEAIMAKAEAIGQEWMKGIGYARWLERFL